MQHLGEKGKDKLFNFRPIFFTAAFFCMGVVFGYFRVFEGVSAWWACLLLGLGAPFFFCGKAKINKTAVAVCVLLVAFFIGQTCFSAQVRNYASASEYNGKYTVQGIVEEKTVGRKYGRVVLSNISVDKKEGEYKLIAYLPTSFCENITLFDEISLRGNLQTQGTELSAEDFNFYYLQAGIKYKLTDAESCVVIGHRFNLFGVIRERVSAVLYAGMDTDPASVTLAVLTGNTAGIEDGLLQNMRYGGIAHVFAVSGLHVGALYAFCILLTSRTALRKTPKWGRFLFVVATLLFYGGICGFSSSVIRAIVLCLIAYAAKLIGTAVDKFEALGLAAILILLLSPAELFGVGFQLSFLACLGIFLWTKPLEKGGARLFGGLQKRVLTPISRQANTEKANNNQEKLSVVLSVKICRKVLSFLSVCGAAQIATAPVLLQAFGYISGWSLLLNCIFVPFIGLIFSALLIFVALACVLPISVSWILLYLPNAVWSAALLLFEAFDFSLFAIRNITLSAGAFFCYYGALSFLSDKWNLSAREKKYFCVLCGVGFALTALILNI